MPPPKSEPIDNRGTASGVRMVVGGASTPEAARIAEQLRKAKKT